MYTMIFSFGAAGIVLIVFGILIRECKCYNLMAGYNTMPAEKKKTYDPAPLANKTGIVLYCAGSFTVIIGIVLHFFRHIRSAILLISAGYTCIILITVILFIAKEARSLNDL